MCSSQRCSSFPKLVPTFCSWDIFSLCVLQLQELLRDFDPPARVELVALDPAEEPDRTQAMFLSFDASQPDVDMPLPVEALLDYIRSLDVDNVTVADGVIRWDGRWR